LSSGKRELEQEKGKEKKMNGWQQRVIDEKRELDEKRSRLDDFQAGDTFAGLEPMDRALLNKQMDAMGIYSRILEMRIERFCAAQTGE